MLEKIKKSFRSASSKNGSYSVGMIALVICMVIVVNLIAGQLPENVKSIDISDNNIYGVSKTSKKVLNKLDKKVTFRFKQEPYPIYEKGQEPIEWKRNLSLLKLRLQALISEL